LLPVALLVGCQLGDVTLGSDRDDARDGDAAIIPPPATEPPPVASADAGVRDAAPRSDVVTPSRPVETLTTTSFPPLRAALDGAAIYWSEAGTPGNGTLKKVALAGGTSTTLASALKAPLGVAVSGADAFVYEDGSYDSRLSPDAVIRDGRVSRVPVAGGAVDVLANALPHVNSGPGNTGTIHVAGGFVYFGADERVAGEGGLFRVAVTGGTPSKVFGLQARAYDMCEQSGKLFFSVGVGTFAATHDLASQTTQVVGDPAVNPIYQTGCAATSGVVTLGRPTATLANAGAIALMPYDGSSVRELANLDNVFATMAVDDKHVYYRDGGKTKAAGIYRVPLVGGVSELFVEAQATFIRVSDTHVYWGTSQGTGAIQRAAK
jgi:hypothetical protein